MLGRALDRDPERLLYNEGAEPSKEGLAELIRDPTEDEGRIGPTTVSPILGVIRLHDRGSSDGSESKHNGTIFISDSRTDAKFNSAGLSTVKQNLNQPND